MGKQFIPLFAKLRNPAFEIFNKLPDGLHQTIGGFDFSVQVADVRLNPTLFHLPDSSPFMDGRDNIKPLSFVRTEIYSFRAVVGFQIAVLDDLPFMPPDFAIFAVVPVNRIFLVAFPPAGRELDSFPVLIKFIDLAALGKPFPTLIHCPHGQHDMGVWVSVPFVMDGKIHAHSFGNKLLAAEIPYKGGVLVGRYLSGNGKHPPPCKLGVPLLLNSFGSVPEGVAVCVLQGSVCREQDFIVDDTTLFRVVFYFLVIFTEQLFAALVSSGGNRRLAVAALHNRDFVVWTGHFVFLLSVFGHRKSRIPFQISCLLCRWGRRVFSNTFT